MDQGIIDTITNLKGSGLSDSEIKTMLKDIGFEDSMIDEALNYMKTDNPKTEENTETEITEEEKESNSEENNLKKHSDTAKLASSIAMNVAQNASNKVDEHNEKVNNLNNRIDDILFVNNNETDLIYYKNNQVFLIKKNTDQACPGSSDWYRSCPAGLYYINNIGQQLSDATNVLNKLIKDNTGIFRFNKNKIYFNSGANIGKYKILRFNTFDEEDYIILTKKYFNKLKQIRLNTRTYKNFPKNKIDILQKNFVPKFINCMFEGFELDNHCRASII